MNYQKLGIVVMGMNDKWKEDAINPLG